MRILLCLLLCLWGWTVAAEESITLDARQQKILGLNLGPVSPASSWPMLTVTGQVALPPTAERWINAPYPGLIDRLHVSAGDTVTKGQTLAHLVSPEFTRLQQDYLTALSRGQLARANYRRDQTLFKQGVIAQKRWQQTESDYQAEQAALAAAEQALRLAGADDETIQRLRQNRRLTPALILTAPIDGVVLDRMVRMGQRVDAYAPLFHLARLETLWLEMNVPQQALSGLAPGDRLRAPELAIDVPISQIGQAVDAKTQTGWVRAVLTNTAFRVKAGQSLTAVIWKPVASGLFKVPLDAVAKHQGAGYVFVRQENGFRVQPVTMHGQGNGELYIETDAIDSQSQIALNGATALKAIWLGLGEEE